LLAFRHEAANIAGGRISALSPGQNRISIHPTILNTMKRLWFLFSFLACAASAQQQPWTLEACIAYANEHNLQLQLNQLNVQLSEEALQLAEQARHPNLNGFATHNYNWGRSFDVFTNLPVTERVQSNNFGLNGNMTVFNGFQLANAIRQAKINLEAAGLDADKGRNDMALMLANAYLQILFSQENLQQANLQASSLRQQLERTSELVSAGVLPESNLLDLQSQLATSELQVVNTTNALAFSKLQLRQILQLPPDQAFEVATPAIPEPQAAEALESSMAIFGTAETLMPEIRSADLKAESSLLGIDMAKANHLPTLSLNYGINTFYSSAQKETLLGFNGTVTQLIGYAVLDPTTNATLPVFTETVDRSNPIVGKFGFLDQVKESLRQSVGLTLSIPIYNRGQVSNGVARAQIAHEQAKLSAQIARNTLRQSIEQAYQDVVAARQTFLANKRQVEALEETFRTTQERFNLGVTNITDFTVAQNNLNVAKATLIRAKYDYTFKRKILDFYMGKPVSL
jgi:outer membrane protein